MTSRLVVIPTRRAHSNHAEVARSIGIDIIAGRYAEGGRLPGDAELTAMFGVSRPVLRESVKTLVVKGLLTTSAGRHRGARARRLEHVRRRRAGLASRCRHRPALSTISPAARRRAARAAALAAGR
jgi:DNA-binding FadR family transcriptional regulator